MTASAPARPAAAAGPRPAFGAVRYRLGLVALLLALAVLAWQWSAHWMSGMDDGPFTALGSLGSFVGIWVTMMAAMMLPSVAPTIALYSKMTRQRAPWWPPPFGAGHVVTWAGAGLVAFGVAAAGAGFGGALDWDHAGRWL